MSPDYTALKADLAPSLCSNATKLKGVCAQLVHYDQVLSVPPRRCEIKMLQALVGQEAFARRTEGAAEAATLVRDVRYLRHICRRSSRSAPTELVLSVYGFSAVRERDVVLRLMRYALRPRVIWTAEVGGDGSGKWEALLVLDMWRWPVSFVFGNREDLVELIEKIFERCRQSIGVLELPGWTDPSTVTALQRLQTGRQKWGNLLCHMNRSYVLQHEVTLLTQQRELERARLREHTDLYFSADNMVYLVRELRAAHLALEHTRNTVVNATHGMRQLQTEMQQGGRLLAHLQSYILEGSTPPFGAEMPQAQPRMQALRQAFVRQTNVAREIESDLNRVLVETALRAPDVRLSPPPPPAFPDPLTSPPLGPDRSPLGPGQSQPGPRAPAPPAPVRFLRMGPHVTLRVMPRPPALNVGALGGVGVTGSGDSHDPIEVD